MFAYQVNNERTQMTRMSEASSADSARRTPTSCDFLRMVLLLIWVTGCKCCISVSGGLNIVRLYVRVSCHRPTGDHVLFPLLQNTWEGNNSGSDSCHVLQINVKIPVCKCDNDEMLRFAAASYFLPAVSFLTFSSECFS